MSARAAVKRDRVVDPPSSAASHSFRRSMTRPWKDPLVESVVEKCSLI